MPDKRYFERIVRDTGFGFDVLERAYHLVRIVKSIFSDHFLYHNLTLKGGTALNFIYFDLPRLSVDLDFNLTGAVSDSEVDPTIKKVLVHLHSLADNLGYGFEEAASSVIWERRLFRYLTVRGPADFVKVEVDKVERIPILEKIEKRLHHPFVELTEFRVPTYDLRELLAMKIKSLFDRAHPRDLFDLYKLSTVEIIDQYIMDLVIVYSCFTLRGFGLPELIRKVEGITKREFEEEASPFLRGRKIENFETIREGALRFLKMIYNKQIPAHNQFLESFRKRQLQAKLLTPEIAKKVQNHPAISFWLKSHG